MRILRCCLWGGPSCPGTGPRAAPPVCPLKLALILVLAAATAQAQPPGPLLDDLQSAATYEEFTRRLLLETANNAARPRWKPDSFFRRYAAD